MTKRDETRRRVLELVTELQVGEAIPPERRLAPDLGVSRLTLRAALDQLVREGWLERRPGSGTFVTEPRPTLSSFSAEMERQGRVATSRTLAFEVVTADAGLGRALGVSPSAEVVRAVRLRIADEHPIGIERLHLPAALVPGLEPADLERQSLYELLERRYGVAIGFARQKTEPTVTDEEESSLLRTPLHSPAFFAERTSYTAAGEIVELVRSVYRGDRVQLVAELLPGTGWLDRAGAFGDAPLPADGVRPSQQGGTG
jgi:GntR family transcriptional regulator